jgi:hypothetical protein
LNIQWENLKPCMPQPHWLLHNNFGSSSLENPSLGGGGGFLSTLIELLLLPDDGFGKPQSPFSFLSVQMRKTTLWASNPKNEKTHTQNKRRDLHCELSELHFSKSPMLTKWDLTHNLEKKHLKHKTNSKHIKKKTTFLSSNTH